MSRVYSRAKNRSEINITLVCLIIIATTIYEHRSGVYQLGLIIFALLVAPYLLVAIRRLIPRRLSTKNIDQMTGLEFERYVAKWLQNRGYTDIKLTEKYDYGVDIIASKHGTKWGIQVKRYSGLVKADAVRQVVTALKKYNCDRAMVVTNSAYSRVAIELARTNQCVLIDRARLFS